MVRASMLVEDGDGFCEVHVNTMEGFYPYFGLGLDCTEAFFKKSSPYIWDSLSLFTTLENEVNPYFYLF